MIRFLIAIPAMVIALRGFGQQSIIPIKAGFDEQAAIHERNELIKNGVPAEELDFFVESKRIEFEAQQTHAKWGQPFPSKGINPLSSCNNENFETGDFTGWDGLTGCAPLAYQFPGYAGICQANQPTCGLCLTSNLVNGRHTMMSGAGTDPFGGFPVVYPGGNFSVMLGNSSVAGQAEAMEQTFTVTAANSNFTYHYAVVLQEPGHIQAEQPFFQIEMFDANGGYIPCSYYYVAAGQGISGFSTSAVNNQVIYKPWTGVSIDLRAYVGQTVKIRFTTADCARGGHFGYAYLDASCNNFDVIQSVPFCKGQGAVLTAPSGFSSYTWYGPGGYYSTGQSTNTIAVPGTYQVYLQSVQGCLTVVNHSVYDATPTVDYTANIVCEGTATDFQATASSTFGTITGYYWDFGGGGSSTLEDPSYQFPHTGSFAPALSIYTTEGCTTKVSKNIWVRPLPTTTVPSSQVSCFGGADGTLSSNTTAGTAPYTYVWSAAATGQTITGLSAGTYSVTVTDTYGCTYTASAVITQPTVLTSSATHTNVSCFGGNTATATASASGATWPFYYNWNSTPAQTTITATGLASGTYTVAVTDSKGCTSNSVVVITQPDSLSLTVTNSNVTCYGSNNATVTTTVTGGAIPYTYQWSNGAGQTATQLAGLPAGAYSLTVTDLNSCSKSAAITITQPVDIGLDGSYSNVSCYGGNDATINTLMYGGTSPYSYSWNQGATNNNLNSLGAATYTLSVTDANGCTLTASYTITQPPALTATTNVSDVKCFGDNTGSATVSASGGLGPYATAWQTNPVQTTPTANNLTVGSYQAIVTDFKGCTATVSATISEPGDITASTIPQAVSCFGGSNGSATASVNGGVAPYTYAWSNGNTSSTVANLAAANYVLVVTDANGCVQSALTTITQPTQLQSAITTTHVSCYGVKDGQSTVSATGGTSPYVYSWSNVGGNAALATGLTNATYSATITDAKGCTSMISTTLTQPAPVSVTSATINVKCNGGYDGQIKPAISGGTAPYNFSWSNGTNATNANNLMAGTYSVLITDAKGCSVTHNALITQPTKLNSLIADYSNPKCYGDLNGDAAVLASGGMSPYTYTWQYNNIQYTSTATGLGAGTYSVQVRDAYGCSSTTNVTLKDPDPVQTIGLGSDTICAGTNHTISGSATGGSGTYSYSWSGLSSASSHTINIASNTSYTVVATDNRGCEGTPAAIHVAISDINKIDLAAKSTPEICSGKEAQLSASISAGGGVTLSWSHNVGYGIGPFTVVPNTSTTYTVTATDKCASSKVVTAFVKVNPNPLVSIPTQSGVGCDALTFEFKDTVGANKGSQYAWDFGDGITSNQYIVTHTYEESGTYPVSLTITDPNGCVSSGTSMAITVILLSPDAAFETNPGKASSVSPKFDFFNKSTNMTACFWDFGDGNTSTEVSPHHEYAKQGTYWVKLVTTNQSTCIDSIVKEIEITPEYSFYVPNTFTPNGDGLNDIFNGVGENVTEYQMQIFDRWGERIFTSESYDKGWDGKVGASSETAQMDVYVYKLKVRAIDGEWHYYLGNVNLIR